MPTARIDESRTTSIVRSSLLVGFLDGTLAIVIAAWRGSMVGALSQMVVDRVTAHGAAGRARVAGGVMTVASMTALVMQRFASRPAPLIWIVPALFLFAGVCLMATRQRSAP